MRIENAEDLKLYFTVDRIE